MFSSHAESSTLLIYLTMEMTEKFKGQDVNAVVGVQRTKFVVWFHRRCKQYSGSGIL